MKRALPVIKCVTIVAFMVTLCATYYLRSEVLKLNRIRFSSENVRVKENLREMKDSHPIWVAEYEVQTENYELRMEHYQEKWLRHLHGEVLEAAERSLDAGRPDVSLAHLGHAERLIAGESEAAELRQEPFSLVDDCLDRATEIDDVLQRFQ